MIGVASSQQNNLFSQPSGYPSISLLHFDGTDGSTTFTDEYGVVWSAQGDAQLDTADKKFGGSSLLLDGANDRINTSVTDLLDITQDFTVECFIKLNGSGRNAIVTSYSNQNAGWLFDTGASTELRLILATGSYEFVAGSTSITTGAWHHVACSKKGSTLRVFLNGTLDGTQTITGSASNPGLVTTIGRDNLDTGRDFDGWIDEFRITEGLARYTTSFTPPALPFTE